MQTSMGDRCTQVSQGRLTGHTGERTPEEGGGGGRVAGAPADELAQGTVLCSAVPLTAPTEASACGLWGQ